ncbi:MAG TPA: histone deacetylase [Solirubrobacteraceae bacterium]|jgi:acetoin utilization deacetylase AcuC-like enzyme|nr:histone deacetylase [Solirubrobacteraceae bacterium]
MSGPLEEVDGLGSISHQYYAREQPLTGVVLLPRQERHDTGENPENTRRLPGVLEHLRSSPEWERLFVLYPRYARIEDALRSHDAGYIQLLEASAQDAPLWLDTDTRVSEGSFRNALLASGAALNAVDAVAMEAYHRPDSLLTLTRPPGHHAGRDKAMGFCLLNHASIAARYAQAQYGLERVAILDWDVHHGNGTQEIHWADPSVLFISLHQWPLYPGTGWLDEVGGGEGEGRTVNIPLPPGSRDEEYLQALDRVALPIMTAYRPQLLIVSAGQDCHAADTLCNQLVSAAGLRAMATRMAAFARDLGIGLVVVHEGGYNVSTLPQLVRSILGGLGDLPSDDDDVFVPEDAPAPAEWLERLDEILKIQRGHWPVLAS